MHPTLPPRRSSEAARLRGAVPGNHQRFLLFIAAAICFTCGLHLEGKEKRRSEEQEKLSLGQNTYSEWETVSKVL